MPGRGMLLLFGFGLVIVIVAWVLLARNPNASDQRATEFGASAPASRPVTTAPADSQKR
jgi:hypothetical protein